MTGKVALVTGAGGGIGRAAALAFGRQGASVVLADVNDEHRDKIEAELTGTGAEAMFVRTDVSRPADVAALTESTIARFGRLDYAFNNAGIEITKTTADTTVEDWDRLLGVNLSGVFLCMRAEIPPMLACGGGVIVNNSSLAGLTGFAGLAAYSATKHAVIGLTKCAALEYAPHGVRVNAVCPGVIGDTEMVGHHTRGDRAAVEAMVAMEPIGRLGRAGEIADAVVWLCSDMASFVTGQALAVDGGFMAGRRLQM
ncbi:MAG TPA: glucose 1-dehydrogenase [Trebonia sp.]